MSKVMLPDGSEINFPEGTPPEEMERVIGEMMNTSPVQPPPTPSPAAQTTPRPEPPGQPQGQPGAMTTMENIGRVLPVADAAATMVTGAYGVPLSGLAGLAGGAYGAITGKDPLETAEKWRQSTEDVFVHKGMTPGGQQITEAASYPQLEFIEPTARFAGKQAEQMGYPMVGAAIHSGISGAGDLLLGKTGSWAAGGAGNLLSKGKVGSVRAKVSDTVGKVKDKIGEKSVKQRLGMEVEPYKAPTVKTEAPKSKLSPETKAFVDKKTANILGVTGKDKTTVSSRKQYLAKAESGYLTVLDNAPETVFKDLDGKTTRLPETVEALADGVDKSKKLVFDEYNSMMEEGGAAVTERPVTFPQNKRRGETWKPTDKDGKGGPVWQKSDAEIKYGGTINKIKKHVHGNRAKRQFAKKTIEYADDRIADLKREPIATLAEGQESIKVLNESLSAYYRDPNPKTAGRAFVDALIADDVRKQMDSIIERTTGDNYLPVRKKYEALRAIENDVGKAVLKEARRIKGNSLADFTNVYGNMEAVLSAISHSPTGLVKAAIIKKAARKELLAKDPNRMVKKLFQKLDENRVKPSPKLPPGVVPTAIAGVSAGMDDEEDK